MLCLLMYLQNKYDSPMLNSNKNNIAKQQFTNSWPNLYSQNLICKSTKYFVNLVEYLQNILHKCSIHKKKFIFLQTLIHKIHNLIYIHKMQIEEISQYNWKTGIQLGLQHFVDDIDYVDYINTSISIECVAPLATLIVRACSYPVFLPCLTQTRL